MPISPVTANHANQQLKDAYSKPPSNPNAGAAGADVSSLRAPTSLHSSGQAPLSNLPATAEVTKTDKTNFFDQLLTKTGIKTEKPTASQMQSRLADIKKMGITLRHHPEPSMVKSYVSEVKSFLTDVRDNAYEGHRSAEDLFEKIDIADKQLDELADDFLASQKPEMQLLDSLGALEGLLVDILV